MRTNERTPLGELANYSLRQSAVPFDPTDSSGQLPSFNFTLTGIWGDPKSLIGSDVALRDWTGQVLFSTESGTRTRGRVTSVRVGSTGVSQFDASTIFERLNSEQTVLPVTIQDTVDPNAREVFREGITQMCLAAGVPAYSVNGYLRYYLNKYSQIGYISDSIYKWRYFGPTTTYKSFVTTDGSLGGYDKPLEINPAQSIIMGFVVNPSEQVAEFRLQAYLPHVQQNAIYTIRRVNNSWYVNEKVGSASTVQLQAFVHPITSSNNVWMMVRIRANAADATKVDITTRMMEQDFTTLLPYYTDYTASGVVSTFRNRPQVFQTQLGYDPSAVGSYTPAIPEIGWVVESDTLQETYPDWQIYISTQVSLTSQAADTKKFPTHIAGFTGNVWDKLRELCSIYDYDIEYNMDQIGFRPREQKRRGLSDEFLPSKRIVKSDVSETVQDREPARSVEIKVYPRVVDSDYNSLMYKADSVWSLEKGEVRTEKVQTTNSFQFLMQPIPVSGVPVPYTSAYSSYVVTGADGYIVDPQWWKDNGGLITVNSTGVSGEIEIRMQAPTVDTVRAPYRISEGAADRPALYIMGYGIALQEPHTVKIMTGNSRAAQDVGTTLDSTFVVTDIAAYNVGYKLASVYGSGESSMSFNSSRADYVPPSDNIEAPTPISDCVYWKGSYYRITDLTISPQGFQVGGAETSNTIGTVNGEFAEGKTVADWNNLHDGKTIANVNMAPLPVYES